MRNVLLTVLVAAILAAAAFLPVFAEDAAPPAPAALKPIKVLLVIGGCCHEYDKQKDVLAKGLAERANIEVTISYSPDTTTKVLNPAYTKADWAKGYDLILHDECTSAVADPAIVDSILAPHKEGLPGVVLHCAMHSFRTKGWGDPKTPSSWMLFTGLQTTGHGPQQPIAITFSDTTSPITKGLENWTTINEELYNNIAGKVIDTATPLARGKQGKADNIVAWTNLYNGKAKVFGTTLGHNTATVADHRYLDLVTRGILWATDHITPEGTPAPGYGPKPAAK